MTEAAQHSTSQHSSTSNGVIGVYGPVEILIHRPLWIEFRKQIVEYYDEFNSNPASLSAILFLARRGSLGTP